MKINQNNWCSPETVAISKIDTLLKEGYEIEVDSPDGWVGVNFFINKGDFREYILRIPGYEDVRCNADHLFETTVGWIPASGNQNKELHFLTKDGFKKGKIYESDKIIPIVDINVEHENHRYYTNDISSHNTGVGKSLFMCHVAGGALMQNKNVLYITLEMAEERIAERIDANLMNVSLNDIESIGQKTFINKVKKISQKTTGKLIVKEYPTASAHVGHFRALLNELKLKKNFIPDIIFIDYLNICASSRIKGLGGSVNTYSYIKSIAEELRGLAVEFDVPILSATQTTRSGFSNSDVGLEDTSESFGLPATADMMFALISTEELANLNQIMVKQLKNRYADLGANQRFVIGIDRPKMRLYDVEASAQSLIQPAQGTSNAHVPTQKKVDTSGFTF